LASCEDPTSPAARGAASLQWATSTLNSKTPQCVPGPHWSNAPVAASDQPQTSASEAGDGFVVDGEQGGVVRCSVLQQGQGYLVHGEIRSTSPDGTLWTEVGLSVAIDGENDAQGTLYITDQQSEFTFSSDTAIVPPKPGCTFSANAAGTQLGVGPGWLWASVQCPHINDNRNRAAQECQIPSGFIVLQNCLRE
jgi:hypothetical protein